MLERTERGEVDENVVLESRSECMLPEAAYSQEGLLRRSFYCFRVRSGG